LKPRTLIEVIDNKYHFHVYHSIPTDNGFYLETNYGPKRVVVWKHEPCLRWSYLWREELAKKGFRQVDRFIGTRDGAPYVKINEEFIVVQDKLFGKEISLNQPQSMSLLGQFVGLLYQTFKEITQREYKHNKDQLYFNNAVIESLDEEKIKTLKRAIVTNKQSVFTRLVTEHWKSIEKRWKQSSTLQRLGQSSIVSLPRIEPKQLVQLEQGCFSFSSNEQHVAYGFQGIAELMQVLYLEEKVALNHVERFYDHFEQVCQPSLNEHFNVLSYLIYPKAFFEIVNKYIHHGFSSDECLQVWMDLCQKQERLDQLHQWFAERLDRAREGAVSL
jgi:hypothetical protein